MFWDYEIFRTAYRNLSIAKANWGLWWIIDEFNAAGANLNSLPLFISTHPSTYSLYNSQSEGWRGIPFQWKRDKNPYIYVWLGYDERRLYPTDATFILNPIVSSLATASSTIITNDKIFAT